jgi:hypothetical protein
MVVRYLSIVVVVGAAASAASAAVTEVTALLNRQVSARARYGGSFAAAPTAAETTILNSSNLLVGPYSDDLTAISPEAGHFASMHSSQNTTINPAFYFGNVHANGSITGNASGYSEGASNFGSSPAFQTIFSVAFTVDQFTTGHVFGTVSSSRQNSSSTNSPALFLVGDILLPGTPQPALLSVQPTSAGSPVNFDQYLNFLPGHRYSIVAQVLLTTGGIATASSSGSGDVTFTADIPAPAGACVFGVAGLLAIRRRR